MLETIKSYINEVKNDNKTFEEEFVSYVMKTQDENIGFELNFILKYNGSDLTLLDKIIASEMEELNKIDK